MYHRFALTAYDLGIYDQAIWLISRFHDPFDTVRGLPILADHFDPILYLLAPLYWIWASPKMLLIVQTLALALGALPVYALARRVIGAASIGLLFALCYLCYQPMEWSNTFDFHPEIFATPFLLGAFYFLICDRRRPYFVLLGLVALTKETAGLSIILLGLYALAVNRRVGWMTVGMGAASLAVALGVLQIYHNGHPSPYFWLFARYGKTPMQIVGTLLRHPIGVAIGLNTEETRRYLFELFQPVFFLPLLAPEALALASPSLLANLLSGRSFMRMIYYQYTVYITPFVFIASIIAFDRIRRWGNYFTTGLLALDLIVSMSFGLQQSPFLINSWPLSQPVSSTQSSDTDAIIRLIPSGASVSAQSGLIPHIDHRRLIYLFPSPFYRVAYGDSVQALKQQVGMDYPPYHPRQVANAIDNSTIEYVVLQPRGCIFPMMQNNLRPLLVLVFRSPNYGIIAIRGDTILLRRGADHRAGLALLARASGTPIRQDMDVEEVVKDYLKAFF
ncbi:MAG: DUF2079 domain-containing protein [Armatimonadetes bacterium]|nr:DUF2079 domain-containing protein [Armatimonadota bacterium]